MARCIHFIFEKPLTVQAVLYKLPIRGWKMNCECSTNNDVARAVANYICKDDHVKCRHIRNPKSRIKISLVESLIL